MEIVCTIGPSSFSTHMIRMLSCAGVTVFRLNLSWTKDLEEIDEFIKIVRSETDTDICLDTHGMKYSSLYSNIPYFTKFDIKAIKHGVKHEVNQIAVSFARSVEMIDKARKLSNGACIVAKIEDTAGVENMTEVIEAADIILIDRGDLSKSVSIYEVPRVCKEIILKSKELDTPVWIATNLLESMLGSTQPTMGEINDIASLLLLGVDGLVLAAETAIGKHPLQCVEFIRNMSELYNHE